MKGATINPVVFQIPQAKRDPRLIALMMPFDDDFKPVHEAIKEIAEELKLTCLRADDIWEDSTIIQDIFSLIYKAELVICDFSRRNTNVFYEAGIVHTLGRKLIPIVQDFNDIPSDMRHHRHLIYDLSKPDWLLKFRKELKSKIEFELARRKKKISNSLSISEYEFDKFEREKLIGNQANRVGLTQEERLLIHGGAK